MKPKYSIIIATKNEEESIAKVICSFPENVRKQSEIIVVDSSTDHTPIIAEKLGVKVIHEKGKGKGCAMKTGVDASKGDIVIFMDGDGTDPPSFIPKLLKKLEHADLVLGSRSMKEFPEDDPMMRRIFRFYGQLSVRPIFRMAGFKVKGDPLAGFRAIRKNDWYRMDLKSNDFRIEAEMNMRAVKLGFRTGEIPIPHLKRGGGLMKSKLVTSPKMWIKIMNIPLKEIKDEKIKNRLKTKINMQ
ncbi:glycosyltransferase family 2 protein [archaeon]|nr:glycosyltransferase family 2 protein [archaeon]